MLPVPQMPPVEFAPEPIDTDTEESPTDLLSQLSTHLAVEDYDVDTINAAAIAASKLLKNLKSRQRAIQKKAKKAAEPPKERATHGSKIPSTAAIFARENSEMAAKWYADGGRIANFNQARGAQTAKYLANHWKDVPEEVRQQYAFKRQAIIAKRAAAADAASVIHQALVNPSGGVPDPMFLVQ
ncbi:hypothetical protein EhV18_00308 [Emiliania huxleyi virus 18]|nr:hypothetical protein EhV18_00308 [Emiliania huxleyi virus 18]